MVISKYLYAKFGLNIGKMTQVKVVRMMSFNPNIKLGNSITNQEIGNIFS